MKTEIKKRNLSFEQRLCLYFFIRIFFLYSLRSRALAQLRFYRLNGRHIRRFQKFIFFDTSFFSFLFCLLLSAFAPLFKLLFVTIRFRFFIVIALRRAIHNYLVRYTINSVKTFKFNIE